MNSKPISHGYYVVGATFLLNFVALGTYYSCAEFLVPLESSFPDVGRGTIACLPSIYLSVALFASLPAGWIQDQLQQYGIPINTVFAFGALCLGFGPLWSSHGSTFVHVLMGAIVTGIGIGLTGFIAAGICVQWFDKNRGTMLLLAMAGTGCGNFVYCNGMQHLMEYFAGGCHAMIDDSMVCESWRQAMRLGGICSALLALGASVVMRLPYPGEVETHEKDEEEETEVDDIVVENKQKKKNDVVVLFSGNSHEEEPLSPRPSEKRPSDQFEYGSIVVGPPCLKRITSLAMSTRTLEETIRTRQSLSICTTPQTSFLQSAISRHSTTTPHRSRRNSSIAEYEALGQLPVNYRDSIAETTNKGDRWDPVSELVCTGPILSLGDVIKTRTTIGLLLWSFLTSFAFTNFFVHVPAFAESVGLPPATGSQALSLTGLCMLVGNITLGFVTDTLGPIRTLQITMCFLVLLQLLWPYCVSPWSLKVVASLYGYMSTTQSSVPLVILADAFGKVAPQSILTLLGLQNVCKFPGYMCGPVLVGHLFEVFGETYTAGAIFTAVFMLIGNVSLFGIPSAEQQNVILEEKYKLLSGPGVIHEGIRESSERKSESEYF